MTRLWFSYLSPCPPASPCCSRRWRRAARVSSLGLLSMWMRGTGRAATCCCSPTPGQVICDHQDLCDTVGDNWQIEKLKLRHQWMWLAVICDSGTVFEIQKLILSHGSVYDGTFDIYDPNLWWLWWWWWWFCTRSARFSPPQSRVTRVIISYNQTMRMELITVKKLIRITLLSKLFHLWIDILHYTQTRG